MKKYLSRWHFRYIEHLIYMLQSSEYQIREYLSWNKRARDYRSIAKRGKLDWTRKAKLLFIISVLTTIILVAALACWAILAADVYLLTVLIAAILLLPVALPYLIILPLAVGQLLIQKPREKAIIARAQEKLRTHPGYKIAIVGSYGKTTAKEAIKTVLATKLKVAATPGNLNQPLAISEFIMNLDGDEDVLIFELGEYKTGDIYEMCQLVQPDTGFITGLSAAHLSSFGSVDNILDTLMGLKRYVGANPIYLNGDSKLLADKAAPEDIIYSESGVDNIKISSVSVDLSGTRCTMSIDGKKHPVQTQLLGEHNIPVIAAIIHIAKARGLSYAEAIRGVEQVKPFEHRMQPYKLASSTIIDDTYNGNLSGVEAGISLLKNIKAKRKIYVTPGLVEQGKETKAVHLRIGELLADAKFDTIVLMNNSTTGYIKQGLADGQFGGRLVLVDDPLTFYSNLDSFVAADDVVLMQNDWTDNYA